MKTGVIDFIKVPGLDRGEVKAYYPFDKLRNIVEHKCKFIIFIGADKKKVDAKELFHFTTAKLLSGLTYNKFLGCVNSGLIRYDFRLGVYKTGEMKGKDHDHGSGFRFLPKDLKSIFTVIELTNI